MMRLVKTALFVMILFTIPGCASNAGKHGDGISMDEWCDKDEDLPGSGCWREIGQIDCGSGDEFESDVPIGEPRLTSDGRYSITWHPFEYYTDIAGAYKINEPEGTITVDHTDEFDGDGLYSIRENGDLDLVDIWFGSFYADSDKTPQADSCGYFFRSK